MATLPENSCCSETLKKAMEIIKSMPKFSLGKNSIVGPVISLEHAIEALKTMDKNAISLPTKR
jgi:hypothetical protein